MLFTSNASCTGTINIFEPHALNLKFQHFIPYVKKIHYFTTMNLELEKRVKG
jgi:hypothetical protein